MKPFLRTPYNYDMNAAGDESGLACKDDTLTKQSFAEECDINTIVRRFNLTGQLPEAVHMPTYGDFEGVFDYKTAIDAIALANTAFMEMPADIRARFDNNPANFVDFCSDERNRDEALALGLLDQRAIDAQRAAANANEKMGGHTTPPVDNSTSEPSTPAKAKK